MKLCYAIQPAFCDTMEQSGDIQVLLEGMGEQQRSRAQTPIEMQSLQENAEAFFQKEIECRKDCLSYDHFLKSRVYVVYMREGVACMEDCMNPSYQLLRRKYRCLLVQEVDKQGKDYYKISTKMVKYAYCKEDHIWIFQVLCYLSLQDWQLGDSSASIPQKKNLRKNLEKTHLPTRK